MKHRMSGKASATFQWTNIDPLRMAPGEKVRDISMTIRNDARSYAPVNTGRLRDSLHVTSQRTRQGDLYFTIYTGVSYAPYQEYGTRYIAPKAFMGRALANARARYGP